MNSIFLYILLIIVIYVAFKYLKGPRNTHVDSDGFTARPVTGSIGEDDNILQNNRSSGENIEKFDESNLTDISDLSDVVDLSDDSGLVEDFENEISENESDQ